EPGAAGEIELAQRMESLERIHIRRSSAAGERERFQRREPLERIHIPHPGAAGENELFQRRESLERGKVAQFRPSPHDQGLGSKPSDKTRMGLELRRRLDVQAALAISPGRFAEGGAPVLLNRLE